MRLKDALATTSLAASLLLAPLAPPAWIARAQERVLPGNAPAAAAPVAMETGDAVRGWQGVGRLLLGERGLCTAALVAPRLIVSAAHCLYDRETGARLPDALLTFEAGWRLGRAEAYRGVSRTVVDPDYVYSGGDAIERIGHDLALLELDRAIALPRLQPFRAGPPPAPGASVTVVSYAQDRAEAPSIERDCPALGRQGLALILGCSVDFGSSGAPVFLLRREGAELVSVVVAKAEYQGRRVALAVPLGDSLEALVRTMDEEAGAGGARVRGVDVLSGGLGGGARFVSP